MSAAAVVAARETLARAARFWAARDHGVGLWDDRRSRFTANGFRELDGFLRVLLDAAAPRPGPAPRHTAGKLHALMLAGQVASDPAPIRLRALGRSTACLFHCAGWVRRPDERAGGWMTAGWAEPGGATLRRYMLGERLRPGADEVADVCDFYLRTGAAIG